MKRRIFTLSSMFKMAESVIFSHTGCSSLFNFWRHTCQIHKQVFDNFSPRNRKSQTGLTLARNPLTLEEEKEKGNLKLNNLPNCQIRKLAGLTSWPERWEKERKKKGLLPMTTFAIWFEFELNLRSEFPRIGIEFLGIELIWFLHWKWKMILNYLVQWEWKGRKEGKRIMISLNEQMKWEEFSNLRMITIRSNFIEKWLQSE